MTAAEANISRPRAARRRDYTATFKRQVVTEVIDCNRRGAICQVAREHGIQPQLLGKWVRQFAPATDTATNPTSAAPRPDPHDQHAARMDDAGGGPTVVLEPAHDLAPNRVVVTPADVLLRGMYNTRASVLFDLLGVIPAPQIPAVSGFGGVAAGVCVAGANLAFLAPGTATVVTGPSVSHSQGQLSQLRFDVITDIMIAVAFAAWAQLDCLIYLTTGEDIIRASQPAAARWLTFAAALEQLIRHAIDDIDTTSTTVTVLRTDQRNVRERLESAIIRHRQELGTSTSATSRPPAGRGSVSARSIYVHHLHAARCLPDVVGDLTSRPSRPTVVVDSLHHGRAIRAARATAARNRGHVGYLGHVPAPAVAGGQRMSIAPPDKALQIGDDLRVSYRKLGHLQAPALNHWEQLWRIHASLMRRPVNLDLQGMAAYYRHLFTAVVEG